ncbi:hypothetical protein, partial [Burkholderia multivorans]|uniref:hypothetical protein n=1 Tax=Burkholderia multivorans TaxID=87883 RepID=UPI00215819AE
MNAMRAALAPIPAEPWGALTAERRIADHAPTAGRHRVRRTAVRCVRDHTRIAHAGARNIAGRRADAPTRLLADAPAPDQKPLNLPSGRPPPPPPGAPTPRAKWG